MSRKASILLGLTVAAVFLALAVQDIEFGAVLDLLAESRWEFSVGYLILLSTFFGLKATRWREILRPRFEGETKTLVSPMLIGFAANNVFPLRAGEVIRIFIVSDITGLPKTYALASLVTERIFDLFAVSVLFSIGIVLALASDNQGASLSDLVLAGSVAVIAAILAGMVFAQVSRAREETLRRWIPSSLEDKILPFVADFASGLSGFVGYSRLIKLALNSLVQWMTMAGCILVSTVSVGMSADPAAVLIVLGITVVGISLPSAPAYVGTIQYGFVLGFGLFGVDASTAFAAAVYYHALNFVSVTSSGAILYLFRAKRS